MRIYSKKNWLITVSIFCIVLFVLSYLNRVEGKESVLEGKPIFKLEVSATGVAYQINVNGVGVMREYYPDSQVFIELPINQFMHPENNEFQYMITPPNGSDISSSAFVDVTLLIKDSDDENVLYRLPILMFSGKGFFEENEMFKSMLSGSYFLAEDNNVSRGNGTIHIDDISKKNILKRIKNKNTLTYTRKVIIPNSLPLWSFFKSDLLPNYYEMSDEEYYPLLNELFLEYEKFQNALVSGDVDFILKMASERSREGDLAFYNKPGVITEKLNDVILDRLNNPEWKVSITEPEDVSILLEDNMKLVSLTLDEASNAIGFINSEGSFSSFPLMFRRENGKWILTR